MPVFVWILLLLGPCGAWAEGYAGHYSNYGYGGYGGNSSFYSGSYVNRFSGGSGGYGLNFYHVGRGDMGNAYGYASESGHEHRADWEAYLRLVRNANLRQQAAVAEPACGNYLRAPRRCRLHTVKYDPLVDLK